MLSEIEQNTWHVTQFATTNLEDDVANKENKPESNENNEKQLYVIQKNGKFVCLYLLENPNYKSKIFRVL